MKKELNSITKKRIILAGLSSAIVILIVAISLFSVVKTKNENSKMANPKSRTSKSNGIWRINRRR